MRFSPLDIPGLVLVDIEPHADERGFFARSFCVHEFAAAGLPTCFPQENLSFNTREGTVRGMHYAAPPHAEGKLVRCTFGAIHDVVIDLRPHSPHYCRSVGITLSRDRYAALYIPPGFAHGFQTLSDRTEVLYHMETSHAPDAARGVRWNDPVFSILWPMPVTVISARDSAWPDYVPVEREILP